MFQAKTKYIPSGEYFVSKTTPISVQAILGTCVGVVIHDKKNGVGGLIHLLLAEPISLSQRVAPQRYASTGLPLFIKELFNAGAKKEQMKAVIAGGALVGPINEQDLALDIGGKTAETTKTILRQNGISVEESETGGVFTCSLRLDFANWEVKIEPSDALYAYRHENISLPGRSDLESAIEKILPIPQVALKVLRIINNDDYGTSKIAEEVRKDQVLSARTLKICNSALFGLRHRISSLEDALVLMGRNRFIQLVISAAVKNYFHQSGLGYSICKGGLYHHAVGNAVITEKIASHTGTIPPGIAYIAGLMHDIGKVVFDQYIGSAYPYLYRNKADDAISLLDIEKEVFGMDHAEVGCLLAEKWGLADIFIDAIKNHHHPDKSDSHLPHMVFIADVLMTRFQAGLEIEKLNTGRLRSSMERVGLKISQFPAIVDLVPNFTLGAEPGEDMD